MRLDELQGPQQLQNLTLPELGQLASEIRQVILHSVSRNGGHLGPNLGTVESTLALHTVFRSPRDKILWDVSHQSYAHKLVTGRLSGFALRRQDGVAGFTRPGGSEHDHFHFGHASTALSAAIGMATARDHAGLDFHVVAVVGDGAMTGGMAYEALNHAGYHGTRLIAVLNDNGMSIAPNVGGVSRLFERLRAKIHRNGTYHHGPRGGFGLLQ